MKIGKGAIKLGVVAIVFCILFVSCISNEEEESKTALLNVVTIDKKLLDLNGEIVKEKDCDLNGDNKEDRVCLVKTSQGKIHILVDNNNEIVDKELSEQITDISFLSDVNSDDILDIFLKGSLNGEPFVEIFISKDEDYIHCRIEDEEIINGIDLNYSIFTFDKKEKKGTKAYLNDDGKKYLIGKGYIDNAGNIHNSNIPLVMKNESIDLQDINDDGKLDLVIKIGIINEEGATLLSKYKIYNFDIVKDSFKLKSIKNNLKDSIINKKLSRDEVVELVYSKTKSSKEIIDYKLEDNVENISEEIRDKFFTIFEIYKDDNGGMASDYLILVSKDDYSLYRYYVDGLILPL